MKKMIALLMVLVLLQSVLAVEPLTEAEEIRRAELRAELGFDNLDVLFRQTPNTDMQTLRNIQELKK